MDTLAQDNKTALNSVPIFRDAATLTYEQINDPDFRLKQLKKLNGGKFTITCSKCHHCR